MDFIGEILFEGIIAVAKNKKISRWIRYPILVAVIGLYGFIFIGLLFLGLSTIKTHFFIGIFFWLMDIGIVFFVLDIFKRKVGRR